MALGQAHAPLIVIGVGTGAGTDIESGVCANDRRPWGAARTTIALSV